MPKRTRGGQLLGNQDNGDGVMTSLMNVWLNDEMASSNKQGFQDWLLRRQMDGDANYAQRRYRIKYANPTKSRNYDVQEEYDNADDKTKAELRRQGYKPPKTDTRRYRLSGFGIKHKKRTKTRHHKHKHHHRKSQQGRGVSVDPFTAQVVLGTFGSGGKLPLFAVPVAYNNRGSPAENLSPYSSVLAAISTDSF